MSDCFVLYLLLTCMKKKTSGADKFTNNTGAYLELPCRNTLADSAQEMILQQTSTATGHHRTNRI